MLARREWILLTLLLTAPITGASGNVVTDWDEKGVSVVQTGTVFPPPTAFRTMAILHVAMFDAMTSCLAERYVRYRPRSRLACAGNMRVDDAREGPSLTR